MPLIFQKRKIFVSLFAILTILSMTVFFNTYEPWLPDGPEQIIDSGFTSIESLQEWTGWKENTWRIPGMGYKGSPCAVLIASSTQHGHLRMTVTDLRSVQAVRVSVRASAEDVSRGKHSWHLPRGIFFYKDANGKSLYGPHHSVFDLRHDSGWRTYTEVFPVPSGAVDGRLQFQNLGSSGMLRIDDVSLMPVRPRPSAPVLSAFFLILWSTAFALSLLALELWKHRGGWMVGITALLIVAGTALPGDVLDDGIRHTVEEVEKSVAKVAPPTTHKIPQPAAAHTVQSQKKSPAESIPAKPRPPVLKLDKNRIVSAVHFNGHLLLFALLGLLSMLVWRHHPAAVCLGLTLFAASTEVLQFVTIDRGAGLDDLLLDLIGAGCGVFAGELILFGTKRLLQCRFYRVLKADKRD